MTNIEFYKLFKNANLTVKAFAEKLSLHRSSVYRYLNGSSQIPKTVELACKAIINSNIQAQPNASETVKLWFDLSDEIDKDVLKYFGTALKNMREERKITQKDFSKLTGLSMSYLSDIENGKKEDLSLSTIQKISKCLHIETQIFFQYCDDL